MDARAPRRGDIVRLDFDPQSGHEQGARRPAIVLTSLEYNERVGLCIVCPITSKRKGRPFEVPIPPSSRVRGVVLAEHVKTLDWRARRCELVVKAPDGLLDDVLDVLADLLEF